MSFVHVPHASTLSEASQGNLEKLYRFGQGASFHEFYVALGPSAFQIPQPFELDRRPLSGWPRIYEEGFIATLESQLSRVEPPPHRAFAQPCLDLILQKTDDGRLS